MYSENSMTFTILPLLVEGIITSLNRFTPDTPSAT